MRASTGNFRYFPWLARDVARSAGLLYLLVLVAVTVVLWRMRNSGMLSDPATVQRQVFGAMLLVAVLVATGGMVSTDVQQGFYRNWFSKPMAPWWYYLQRWLLGGLVLLSTPLIFGGILALIGSGHGITWSLLASISLGYLLIGSAVFLASTVLRWVSLLVFLVSFAQGGLHGIRTFGAELPGTIDLVYRALPPFHLVNPSGPLPAGTDLLHVVGYGAAMLILALLVLTFRPLGSGGRA
ncbi:MAG TPA: hypothetical protein PLL69_05440 [Gemmatimonadales bacterium]|nr:hypothetical protein [Gemmatimonadales bacterium]